MKNIWIILLMVAVALALAVPAAGKGKPDKPDKTVTYDVTMDFVGDQPGLSTTECSGAITMSAVGGHQGMLESQNAEIWIKAPDVQWSRQYDKDGELLPDPPLEGTFDGCHGPSVNPEGPFGDYGSRLFITPGEETIEFIWHFDYYLDGEGIQRGGKNPPRLVRTVAENFTMVTTAHYDADGLVSGWFPIARFLNEDGNAVTTTFEPEAGTYLTFYLTIKPTPTN
jgi:hypothetical protein